MPEVQGTQVHIGYDKEYGWWVFDPEHSVENAYPGPHQSAALENALCDILGSTAVVKIKQEGSE